MNLCVVFEMWAHTIPPKIKMVTPLNAIFNWLQFVGANDGLEEGWTVLGLKDGNEYDGALDGA